MIFQLKNGDWITPANVTDLRAGQASEPGPYAYKAHVIVITIDGRHTVDCDSFEEAYAYRDELAALVNATHAKPGAVAPEKSWRERMVEDPTCTRE